jgi:lipopolysaccharide/colanic/teichoic acid biosynthesis glycosyltransferase
MNILSIVTAFLLLVLSAPFMVCIAGLIFIDTRSSPFFAQKRIGQHGRAFTIYKFRTMLNLCDSSGRSLPDDQRLMPLGRFLRKASLDELPQLWNVIRGDMSLVGPRPLLPEYVLRYNESQRRRHEVRPGITGWAQVNGRNALTWEEKFDLDVWYVDHRSFWIDIKILWLTLLKVLRRDGISQDGHATVPEFIGTENVPGQHE